MKCGSEGGRAPGSRPESRPNEPVINQFWVDTHTRKPFSNNTESNRILYIWFQYNIYLRFSLASRSSTRDLVGVAMTLSLRVAAAECVLS